MTKHRLGVLAACGAAGLALAAPATSHAQDPAPICNTAIGSADTTYDFGVVRARVKTCYQADVPQCGAQGETYDIGPFVRIRYSICLQDSVEDL